MDGDGWEVVEGDGRGRGTGDASCEPGIDPLEGLEEEILEGLMPGVDVGGGVHCCCGGGG